MKYKHQNDFKKSPRVIICVLTLYAKGKSESTVHELIVQIKQLNKKNNTFINQIFSPQFV